MAEIPTFMDEIVNLQNAVPKPTDERDVQVAYDEAPSTFSTFPVFLNIEEDVDQEYMSGNWGYLVYVIGMHLLFGSPDAKYAYRSRRKWLQPVIKHFRQNPSLNNTCAVSTIRVREEDTFEWNGTPYIAANFELRVKTQEDW